MSHQDLPQSRTSGHILKELIQALLPDACCEYSRHGNAVISSKVLVATALLAFAGRWQETLTARVLTAAAAVGRIWSGKQAGFRSRQGLFKALGTCGVDLLTQMRNALASEQLTLSKGTWRRWGRPTFACDGTEFEAPRTQSNQDAFAATARRGQRKYATQADQMKASVVQLGIIMIQHIGTGLPYCWCVDSQRKGERDGLLELLAQLPQQSRLLMDALYIGYRFWDAIMKDGHTFVVRAGSNVELLRGLGGSTKVRGDLVFYWPDYVAKTQPPILLSLVRVQVGKKTMSLLTNELELSDHQLATLYAERWGIEVFFRTVKQSMACAKLESRTSTHLTIEIQWTMLALWAHLFAMRQQASHVLPTRTPLSPVRVLRLVHRLIIATALRSSCKFNLANELQQSMQPNESGRTSSKQNRGYPRKRKRKTCGEPKITQLGPKETNRLLALCKK